LGEATGSGLRGMMFRSRNELQSRQVVRAVAIGRGVIGNPLFSKGSRIDPRKGGGEVTYRHPPALFWPPSSAL
jgi:hypothetical protein